MLAINKGAAIGLQRSAFDWLVIAPVFFQSMCFWSLVELCLMYERSSD